LKGAGLLDSRVPADFSVPVPNVGEELTEDEDPLEDEGEIDISGGME
jgi:segregation and condensation protein B